MRLPTREEATDLARSWRAGLLFAAAFFLLVFFALVAAIIKGGGGDGETSVALASLPPVSAAPVQTTTTTPDTDVLLADTEIESEVVVEGLDQPQALTTRATEPGLYVGQRDGLVRWYDLEGEERPRTVLDLREEIGGVEDERGLYDIEFSPSGDQIFVSMVVAGGDGGATQLVAAYRMDGDEADPDTRIELLDLPDAGEFNVGGQVEFGLDQNLYISVGDGGGYGIAQDRADVRGTILRGNGKSPVRSLQAPNDNPFVNDGRSRPEVWSWGLRDPRSMTFDPETGDMWLTDVGESTWEEINHLPSPGAGRGINLGWPILEGVDFFTREGAPDVEQAVPEGYRPPDLAYQHEGGRCGVIGGVVYRGEALEALVGDYLFTDLCEGRLRSVHVTPDEEHVERDLGLQFDEASLPVAFGATRDGEVVYADSSQNIRRLVPAGS